MTPFPAPSRGLSPPVRLARVGIGLPELLITAGYAGLFFFLNARSPARRSWRGTTPTWGESLHHHS
ncbi:MAG TPA: hypothetical protein VFE33_25775 [Thermoanaerobaculia bacterium]|nr:hypothetical protein [Thermoanaerobaculia bacterium]